MLALTKRAGATTFLGYALLLALSAREGHAFSSRSLRARLGHQPDALSPEHVLLMSSNYANNMNGPPPGMRGPPPYPRKPGPPQPPPRRFEEDGPMRNQYLDRHAVEYLDDLRAKRSGPRGSYSANNPPGAFSVPNAGNTAAQPRARGVAPDARGLAGLASGVRTPMDKYNYEGPTARYQGRDAGYGRENYNRGPGRDNYNSMNPGPSNVSQRDFLELQDEVERLRTENAMLKRTAQDLMNSFNELSNRLFDVDESLKKVAKVFPSEEEMESLEWLLKK